MAAYHVGAVVAQAAWMFASGGAEKKSGGVNGSATDSDNAAEVGGEFRRCVCGAVVLNFDAGNGGACWICNNFCYFSLGQEGDVGKVHDLPDAVDVGIRLGVDEARIAIAGVTADALGIEGVGSVAFEADRNWKGVVPKFLVVVVDGLHARFVGERGEGVGFGVEGLGGVRTG